ncbi:hypothetical protein A2865_02020 [Candidatus Woesebacteria bacterium RIFCSPHIGHO2_01_FULL_39_17]|uniref:Sulfatase N-terminal domain-containing protein n=3 Tax=Candidatus Woeseibacteriota TaxID=1752722 RepID=A0A0G0NDS0_9BACT|nr:MAG: hypothetical protein US72_C0004G0025 [Microgenomates group bacterium GW2011_GWC1_38_12]KKQ93615.1 MAG: hypothetical protein UT19_C0009G0024 [Candidatus Woesebacteria bacterium GW2011_GWB1_39_10b]KKR13613.1 MAG: hypothetical protein UT40_C0013G0014 [Candidatus Woesebacteria bacterium GW2011_GWA1_39_21b]OGM23088.1 MAG: hypothetical protein A2865_02020 [Candidatus Woesebacteria bacterium RIFCSPHIGHO2_01_FULL_39_17]OGM61539.1 MAG: hypothetical protein A3A52_04250 [Candidatus Woesebacteria b
MIFLIAYPFLFSLFPIFSLYLKNFNQVSFGDVVDPTIVVLFFSLASYLGSFMATRKIAKASLITFVFIFFVFSFEPVFSPFRKILSVDGVLTVYPWFFIFWIALFLVSLFFILWTDSHLTLINKFLSLFSIFLIFISFARLVTLKPWKSNNSVLSKSINTIDVLTVQKDSEEDTDLPDIYYIIVDRYLRNDILQENYGFDNSDFLNFLREKGFYVAEASRSNYLKTGQSLASSLNMQYINYLSQNGGENSESWGPVYSLLEKNLVVKTLKDKGYKYIHLGSWWEPTRKNDFADININIQVTPEFSENLLQNTVFYPVKDQLFAEGVRKEQYDRTLYELDYLKKIPLINESTFTFAHLLITHPPYVFDEKGNYVTNRDEARIEEKESYVIQVKITNKLLEDLITEIFQNSERKPVIVIQSDEGKYPVGILQFDHRFDWFKGTSDQVKEKTAILNAIYIPDTDAKEFYPSLTPVNTFRIVFNKVFNTNMDLLPDESYLNQDDLHPYKFKKVE